MQLGSMFISNSNNALRVSDAFCFHPQEHLETVVAASGVWHETGWSILYTIWLRAEVVDLGRPYWILHPVSYHTPEAVTTVFKCFWGWTPKASETCRALLQLLINILPSCITLVLYIYIYIYIYIHLYVILISFPLQQCYIIRTLPAVFLILATVIQC